MSLRMVDHPVVLIPFFLLVVSFLTGGEVGWVLMGLSFWIVLYISFTSEVRVEGQKIVIRVGKPFSLAKKEIPPEEIVEIIELPSAYGIRLVGQFQRPWVPLGSLATGVFVGILLLLRGEFYGVLWVYVSLLSFLDYILRPKEKRTRIFASVVISLSSALAFLYLGHPEFSLGVIIYGFLDAVFASDNYGQEALIIKTENERIVLLGDPASKKKFFEEIKVLLAGGSNAQTS
ncbi:hypothetical protein [Thermococcus sp.]